MSASIRPPSPRHARGFTLTELAVVLAIVALLLGSLMYTLSAQTQARSFSETQRRLEEARDLVLGFAIANARLPCPAAAPPYPPYNGAGDGNEAPAGGACTNAYTGFLPAKAIGFQPVDSSGYAIDAWGNPIRYAVTTSSSNRFTTQHTSASPWSLSGTPTDLVVCDAWGGNNSSCGTANPVTNDKTVVAVIWSQGKNFASTGAAGSDEAANNKLGASNNHPVFVWHTPVAAGQTGLSEFDDQMVWIPVGLLYGRMIAAGVLP